MLINSPVFSASNHKRVPQQPLRFAGEQSNTVPLDNLLARRSYKPSEFESLLLQLFKDKLQEKPNPGMVRKVTSRVIDKEPLDRVLHEAICELSGTPGQSIFDTCQDHLGTAGEALLDAMADYHDKYSRPTRFLPS